MGAGESVGWLERPHVSQHLSITSGFSKGKEHFSFSNSVPMPARRLLFLLIYF